MKVEYLNNKSFENNIIQYRQFKQEKFKYELILGDLNTPIAKFNKKGNTLLEVKTGEYKTILKQYEEFQNRLAADFSKMAENIIRYKRFNFVEVDDAIQEFIVICFKKIELFDPAKGKAFNYITTCILNHYKQLYRTARNYNEFQKKYGDHLQTQYDRTQVKTKSSTIAREKFSHM